MLPMIPSLSFLFVLVTYWLLCRVYGWRATLSPATYRLYFAFGCVGSTLFALYLQAIPMPFASEPGTMYTKVSPETWLTGPGIEEIAKVLPMLVIVWFVPAARRISVADFALIGLSTGLGFGFVEGNLGRVLSSDLFGWTDFWRFGFDVGTRQAQYLTYSAGHWGASALVGLALGIGVRLWPDRYLRWLPGAVMLMLVAFDHSMWNFKQQHQYPNSFDLASQPIEWIYALTQHGYLEIAALPVLLVIATFVEGLWTRRAVAPSDEQLLPGEYGGSLAFGELTLLFARMKLGPGPMSRTLTYFRHRRTFRLAVADAARSPTEADAVYVSEVARRRLIRERTMLVEQVPSTWLPARSEMQRRALSAVKRHGIGFLISGTALLEFGIAPGYVPWLHGRGVEWMVALAAVALVTWRLVHFWVAGAPNPRESGSERLISYYASAMLLGSSVLAATVPLVTLLLDRQWLLPSAVAYLSSHLTTWTQAGGSPGTLIALGALVGAAVPVKYSIQITLLDNDDQPVGDEYYIITLPDQSVREGYLGSDGTASEDSDSSGMFRVNFPHIDRSEWGRT